MSECPACDGLEVLNYYVERHHDLLRAERERVKRLEAVLREADRALLRALSDLMGYEDGRRTATQDLVKHAAERANAALRTAIQDQVKHAAERANAASEGSRP